MQPKRESYGLAFFRTNWNDVSKRRGALFELPSVHGFLGEIRESGAQGSQFRRFDELHG